MKYSIIKKNKVNIVFIGSKHQPNIDACDYIIKFAKKLPKFNFKIIGNLNNYYSQHPSNIKFYGVVSEEEKDKIYSECFLALNPIVSGSGSNMKIIDYMKNGLICLTTKYGLRGFEDFSDYFFIEEIEKFPNKILEISSMNEIVIRRRVRNPDDFYSQNKIMFTKNILQVPDMLKRKTSNIFFYDNSLLKRNITGVERYISELYGNIKKIHYNTYAKGIDLQNIDSSTDIKASTFHRTFPFFNFDELNAAMKFKNIIYTYHDSMLYKYPYYFKNKNDYNHFKLSYELSFKISKKIIAITNSNKEELISLFGIDENRIKVIYHGINRSKFKKLSFNLNKDVFSKIKKKYKIPNNFFLAISTDFPHKNLYQLSLLADKMSKISDLKKFRIVLVGNKYYHDNKFNCISKNIIDLGPVPDQDLNILYNLSTIFFNLSLDEGFGMTNLEAQYMNVPVICSNIKPFKELLSESAFFVDPEKNDEIMDATISLIKNADLYESLKSKGFTNSENFSWEKCQKETFNLIRDLN